MKTLKEIFGSGNLPSDFLSVEELYSKNYAFSCAQTYAEEYAKAAIEWMIWCSTGVNPDTEVVNARMNEFKESLKK